LRPLVFALFAVKPLIHFWKLKAVTAKNAKNFRQVGKEHPTDPLPGNYVGCTVLNSCDRTLRTPNPGNFEETSVPSLPDNGMVHLSSPYSVAETIKRLESLLHAQGLTEFCRIDHSCEAEKAGLKMHPTEVIIFGSPKGGTPVMTAAPTVAIDLPLKALIWEDGGGKVWVSYNSPEYLKQRHNIPDELVKNIAGIGPLLQKVVG
jgi:uncharacterized protein (DUF302 family)